MSNVCFAFGPDNSYFCNCPSKWVRNKLPAPVERLFTKQPPIKDVYELALGPNDSYYIGYLDHDNITYHMNGGLPAPLASWLAPNSQGFVERDIRTTQVTLGPNNSYVAKDKNKMQWSNIPDPLVTRLRTYRTNGTKLVTLGKDGSYVAVGTDGSGLRDLRDHFGELEQRMAGMTNLADIHYLSLSSFNAVAANGGVDEPVYMLVTKDGGFHGLVPETHSERFAFVTAALPNMRPAPAPAPGPRIVPAARTAKRHSSSVSAGNVLKILSTAAKVANVAANVMNGGSGGGGNFSGGDFSGGSNFDTSGFQAGLQDQTWSSVGGAAADPIQ